MATTTVRDAAGTCRPLIAAGDTLIVCDFDGTLALLARDPWSARIVPAAQRALRRLSVSAAVSLVFLSGRTVSDLAGRTRVGGATYLGDHGAERAEAVRGFRPGALQVSRTMSTPQELAMAARLASEVPARIGAPWLVVEPKGAAVAFHFRTAPDLEAARVRVSSAVEAIDADGLLQRHAGATILDLRPWDAPTKGTTMTALLAERNPRSVIHLGDGYDDALGFDVIRSARVDGRLAGRAIAVVGRPDVTTAIAHRADLTLASPHDVARLLSRLAGFTGGGAGTS